MTVVYFIIALSILIIIHEFGHYIVARLSGIRVEKFSVGFGPKIWGIKRGDTEYKVSLLPFGGFVKMSGDDPADVDKDDKKAFYNKSVFTRARVVAAGPIMNLILCIILMPIVFMIGKSEPAFLHDAPVITEVRADSPAAKAGIDREDVIIKVGDKEVKDWKDVLDDVLVSSDQDLTITVSRGGAYLEKTVHIVSIADGRGGYLGVEPPLFIGNEAVADGVRAGSPASKAGIEPGDTVVAIDGQPIGDWTDMIVAVGQSKGSEVEFTVKRADELLKLKLTPEYDEKMERYLIGVSKDMTKRDIPMVKIRYGFFESITEGWKEVGRLGGLTFKVLGRLVTGRLSYKTLGGPIQIAQATAAAARSGISSFLFFLAFLSMQLGILNLLPIPVLDGGHLVFFGIEAIRRKPLSERVQGIASQVGMALIILLLLVVSFNDLMHIESIRNILDKLF
jgi:regulator of sigma E protease